MISQTAEYALRAIVCLAEQPETPRTNREIARIARVPAGYLSKVMQGLVRAKLVSSQRGPRGGFLLRPSPEDVSVLAVVNAVDPVRRIHACPLNLPEHKEGLCPLHLELDRAMAGVEASLSATTIACLLKGPVDRRPLDHGAVREPKEQRRAKRVSSGKR